MSAKNELIFSEQDLYNRMTALYSECESLESYILDLSENLEKALQQGTEPQVLHQQYVLFRNLMGAHEEAGRKYAEYIHNKDAQIAILKASYEALIKSSWWKKTEKMRYVEEVLQKHLLHTKTMSQTLAEIAATGKEAEASEESEVLDAQTTLVVDDVMKEIQVIVPVKQVNRNIKNLLAALKGQRVNGKPIIMVLALEGESAIRDICEYMQVDLQWHQDIEDIDKYVQMQKSAVVVSSDTKLTDQYWLKTQIS